MTIGMTMELLQAMKERRSIRKFKPDPVPKDLVKQLLANAMWAPSGMNTQPWKFYVLTGAKRDAFAKISGEAIHALDAGLRELFHDKMRYFIHGFFKNLGDAPMVVVALTKISSEKAYTQTSVESTSAAVQNFLLLLQEAGLATCWMNGQAWVEKEIMEFLGETDHTLVAVLPIGYADQVPPVPPRKHENIVWLE